MVVVVLITVLGNIMQSPPENPAFIQWHADHGRILKIKIAELELYTQIWEWKWTIGTLWESFS